MSTPAPLIDQVMDLSREDLAALIIWLTNHRPTVVREGLRELRKGNALR